MNRGEKMNIKVKNVTKVFNENTIIKDITYEFKTIKWFLFANVWSNIV